MNARDQRKFSVALVVGLVGLSFGLVALAHHDGRQIVARWAALMVIGFWFAAHVYRERKQPETPTRRWGEGT